MHVQRLRTEWHARKHAVPIHSALSFEHEGLVLGAGTVVVPAEAERRLRSLDGSEAKVLTLLSAAYARPVSPLVLGYIDRAAKCWKQGEDCLALIHLALGGLHTLEDHREAARRLFIADGLMEAGVAPSTILKALDLDPKFIDAIEKLYNPAEARVPAGNGAGSGEWAKGLSVLADLSASAAEFLVGFAERANPVTLALGLILIPRNNDSIHVEGDVPELPGLHYAWNHDETRLRLTYRGQLGLRVINADLAPDGLFHDGDRVVARLLPDDTLAIDPAQVSSDLADKDGPNLCPTPGKDRPGRAGAPGEKDKDYEDQIKRLVNPDNPTPRGYGYQFFNPYTGNLVNVDDCQHQTGARVEIKSEYDHLLAHDWGKKKFTEEWLDQSARYMQVSDGYAVVWVFAQRGSADFARKLFKDGKHGQERIDVHVVRRAGGAQR